MSSDNILDCELNTNNSASYLVSLRVNYAELDIFTARLAALNERLTKHNGFKSVDVIRRDDGLGVDIFCIARFSSAVDLELWRNSPQRLIELHPIEQLSERDVTRQQAYGSNIWFEPISTSTKPAKPPLLWKRWLVSLIAVYPALIVLIYLLKPITSKLAEPIGLLLVATILTGITTSLIAPWLSRKLHKWLISNQ